MLNDGKFLGKGRIKHGSWVGQDFHQAKWNDGGEVFDVYEFNKDRVELVAFGYGELGTFNGYGNGRLYVAKEDIIWVSDCTPSLQPITSWGWG